jgi:hypothetical protein
MQDALPDSAPAPAPPVPARSPVVPAIVAWLVPGAGHALIGRRWPAVFIALGTWPLLVGGLALSGFENVSWDRHPWLFALQGLTGLPAVAAALLTKGVVPPEFHEHHTVGDLFTCVAGLLNVVAIADVWARCVHGDPEERLARAEVRPRSAEDLVEASPAAGAPAPTELPRG